jgi:hypothetical protein
VKRRKYRTWGPTKDASLPEPYKSYRAMLFLLADIYDATVKVTGEAIIPSPGRNK